MLVALVGGYWWQRPLLVTGTGYAAHNACAVQRISGRDDPERDLPDNPLVPVLRWSSEGDVTTASILGVLAKQRAWYTDGYGCTVGEEPPSLPPPGPVLDGANPYADVAAPVMTPEVERAVAAAFGDELGEVDRAALDTRAVVVLKDGEVVAERYGEGFDADTPQLVWSVSKSVTSLLVGRLVAEGLVDLDDDRLRPEWTDGRADITVEHLLAMTSGLQWDETYALGTPITQMLYAEPDMGDYVAGQGLAHPPGTYQQYSSGSTTLLCDILVDRLGAGPDLMREALFAPMGLRSAVMEVDASGTPVCSSYLWLTPRDLVALGQLALQDGEWQGQRLLPAGWMAETSRPLDIPGDVRDDGEAYGLGWWSNVRADGSLVEPDLPRDTYSAQGHDGQRMFVVPSEGLVVLRLGFSPAVEDTGASRLVAALVDAL